MCVCAHASQQLLALTLTCLQLDLERKLRALLTKEKDKAEEQAALSMGLCTGAFTLPWYLAWADVNSDSFHAAHMFLGCSTSFVSNINRRVCIQSWMKTAWLGTADSIHEYAYILISLLIRNYSCSFCWISDWGPVTRNVGHCTLIVVASEVLLQGQDGILNIGLRWLYCPEKACILHL